MVFARTSKAASRLSSQFAGHGAKKRYFALACGHGEGGQLQGISGGCRRGAPACARPRTRRPSGPAVLPAPGLCPGPYPGGRGLYTGRHHQIRLQFAGAGLPLYGTSVTIPRQSRAAAGPLAYSLTIQHPTLHKAMTFTALPQGGAWDTPGFAPAMAGAAAGFRLVYQDENLLAVDKPTGLATAAADEAPGADTLEARLAGLFGPVYPLHRLDVNTTGLVLFARNAPCRDALLAAFAQRQIHKTYHCVVKGRPQPPQATRTAYARKDPQRARVQVLAHPAPEAKEMVTSYQVLSTKGDASLLAVDLHTGRTHQIRAHGLSGPSSVGGRQIRRPGLEPAPQGFPAPAMRRGAAL